MTKEERQKVATPIALKFGFSVREIERIIEVLDDDLTMTEVCVRAACANHLSLADAVQRTIESTWEAPRIDDDEHEEHAEEHERQVADERWAFITGAFVGVIAGVVLSVLLSAVLFGSRFFR